jgi:membrane associated rhomboid family serine protease
MIVLFLGLHLTPNPSSETALNRWGYLSAFQIWSGGPRYLYVLLTSSFLHQALGHIALNLVAIWIVGRVIEPILGTKRMAWLILGSALVSSASQLAIFGNTGLGASGIAYGLFGFGLVKRKKFAEVKRLFSERFIVVWLTWFGAAWVILTRQIANGGHLGGLVFGLCAGGALLSKKRPLAKNVALAGFVVLAIALGMICPWSGAWWSAIGFRAHSLGYYEWAVDAYEMSLQIKPDQTWVLGNLARAQWAVGKRVAASGTLLKLRVLDADMGRQLEAELANESR